MKCHCCENGNLSGFSLWSCRSFATDVSAGGVSAGDRFCADKTGGGVAQLQLMLRFYLLALPLFVAWRIKIGVVKCDWNDILMTC